MKDPIVKAIYRGDGDAGYRVGEYLYGKEITSIKPYVLSMSEVNVLPKVDWFSIYSHKQLLVRMKVDTIEYI